MLYTSYTDDRALGQASSATPPVMTAPRCTNYVPEFKSAYILVPAARKRSQTRGLWYLRRWRQDQRGRVCWLLVALEYENMDPISSLGQQARGLRTYRPRWRTIFKPLSPACLSPLIMKSTAHLTPYTKLTSWGKFAAQAHLAWPLKLFTRTVANQGAAGRRGRPEILGSIHHAYVRRTKLLRVRGDMFALQLPKSR